MPNTMIRKLNSWILASASLVCACEQNVELPDIIWKGERIHYGIDRSEQLCGGTLEYLDQRAFAMQSKYGGKPIKYYWVDDVTPFCGPKYKGCATWARSEPFGIIFAEDALMLHEVAHIRQNRTNIGALEEGIAVRFGDPTPLATLSPREEFIDELHAAPVRFRGGYSRAGHFMAFLSETYGWETLLELDDVLADGGTIDAAMRSIVGVGLDEVLAAYSDYPDCLNIVDNSIAARLSQRASTSSRGCNMNGSWIAPRRLRSVPVTDGPTSKESSSSPQTSMVALSA